MFGGLEPLDQLQELLNLVGMFRCYTNDDIVIYTGYTEEEIKEQIKQLAVYSNLIVKFGRFVPNQKSRFDDVLGIELASPNQYARRIS